MKQFSRRSKTQQHLKQIHEKEGEEARRNRIKPQILYSFEKNFYSNFLLEISLVETNLSDPDLSKKIEEILPGSPRYKPHFDRGDFECDQCSRKLSSATHLKRHKQAVHGETFEKIVHGSKECEICGKVFAAPKDKRKHVEAVHQGLRYECPFCLKGWF